MEKKLRVRHDRVSGGAKMQVCRRRPGQERCRGKGCGWDDGQMCPDRTGRRFFRGRQIGAGERVGEKSNNGYPIKTLALIKCGEQIGNGDGRAVGQLIGLPEPLLGRQPDRLCQERYDQQGTEPPGYQGKSPLVEDAAEHRAWPFSPACGDL